MNKDNFEILEHLTDAEINDLKYDEIILMNLIHFEFNEDNIYEILEFAEYYQFKKTNDLIFKIQVKIFDDNFKLNPELIKYRLRDLIFDGSCVNDGYCNCSFNIKKYIIELNHISCFKYLTEIKKQTIDKKYNLIDELCYNTENCLELVKYLHILNYKGTTRAIDKACLKGHLDIIKYLHELNYKGTKDAIDYASFNGHLEIIKYLHELNYKGTELAIDWASLNGHLEIIKYLHELNYKGTEFAINLASENGHLDVIKYLHVLNYKGTNDAIDRASCGGYIDVVKYILNNPDIIKK